MSKDHVKAESNRRRKAHIFAFDVGGMAKISALRNGDVVQILDQT